MICLHQTMKVVSLLSLKLLCMHDETFSLLNPLKFLEYKEWKKVSFKIWEFKIGLAVFGRSSKSKPVANAGFGKFLGTGYRVNIFGCGKENGK